MKTNSLLTPIAAVFLCAAGTCAAQSMNDYQQFGITPNMVSFLNLQQSQVDAINVSAVAPLNYYWNEYVGQIESLQSQANDLLGNFNSNQSAQTVGQQIGQFTAQWLGVYSKLVAQINASHAIMLNILTPTQQSKLLGLINSVPAAENTLNLSSEAFYGNFFVETYTANGFADLGSYGVPSVSVTTNASDNMIKKAVAEAVSRIRAQRENAKAETTRKGRFVR